jgi:hypothetical protein
MFLNFQFLIFGLGKISPIKKKVVMWNVGKGILQNRMPTHPQGH